MTEDIGAGACVKRDLASSSVSFSLIWLAPIALAVLTTLVAAQPSWASPAAWSTAFGWMGGACLLNARRCGRLHCYFSGPILIGGSFAALALASQMLELGRWALAAFVVGTLSLAALTYGLEALWGKYRRSKARDRI